MRISKTAAAAILIYFCLTFWFMVIAVERRGERETLIAESAESLCVARVILDGLDPAECLDPAPELTQEVSLNNERLDAITKERDRLQAENLEFRELTARIAGETAPFEPSVPSIPGERWLRDPFLEHEPYTAQVLESLLKKRLKLDF